MDSQELDNDHNKNKRIITILSVVISILTVILLALIVGLFYFYSRLREPIQELIKQGQIQEEFVMKLIFKD